MARLSELVIDKIHIVNMHMLIKVICRFNVKPIKIPMTLLIEQETTILKFMGKYKRPQADKATLAERAVLGTSCYLIPNYTTES